MQFRSNFQHIKMQNYELIEPKSLRNERQKKNPICVGNSIELMHTRTAYRYRLHIHKSN